MRTPALAVLLAALVWCGAASAAPDMEIGMEDERIMLTQPSRAPAVVAEWASLGVEVVRLHARWEEIAPGRAARRRPAGFRPGDPGDRRYRFAALDRAVSLARSAGMRVELTVTGPGPLWASRAKWRGDGVYAPDPRAFAAYARAIARRYRDRIARYLVWNEPNISGWLSPQLSCSGSRCAPVSPHLYRDLVRAAVPAIKGGDWGARVLMGELAPIGEPLRSESATIPPLAFLRAMACVDSAYRPIRTGRCARFRPARADGFGHHPHGKRAAPDQPSLDPDWAKIGDLRRLERVLDRLTRARRLIAPGNRFDIWLTEFGYQTSPPDHWSGITVAHQASWLQQASYLAWKDPRVRSLTFYQWEDEPVRWRGAGSIAYAGWQSGLRYVDGEPKPALAGFIAPLVVDRRHGAASARVWGQIRPGGEHTVTLQGRAGSAWKPLASVRTDDQGVFTRILRVRDGQRLRMAWAPDDPNVPASASGTVTVEASASSTLAAATSPE